MATTDERKPVTVLLADLVGSTKLATEHDPEQLRALLSAFFDEMRQQIEAFGGTVEKFARDAVMAVFGVPRVNEDDAERAVRAAFAMQQPELSTGAPHSVTLKSSGIGRRDAPRMNVFSGSALVLRIGGAPQHPGSSI